MRAPKTRNVRAGNTEKVSVSIDREDLEVLRRRARRLYGGNLSAVIAEGVKRVREEEGRESLLDWLGPAGEMTQAERDAIDAEWRGQTPAKRRRRGRAA